MKTTKKKKKNTQGFKLTVMGISSLMVLVFLIAFATSKTEGAAKPIAINEEAIEHLNKQPVKGDENAGVSIVEFGDFKCPGCKFFAENIYPMIIEDFVEPGTANFKFVNFPFLGPDSLTAAEASEYVLAKSPSDYWRYFETIYQNQQSESTEWATIDYLVELAKTAGVNVDYTDMHRALENGDFSKVVAEDLAFSRELGIKQTPTLVVNGIAIQPGGLTYIQLKEEIQKAIDGTVKGDL